MPNYGLFVNSTFRPFSYAEMIQPVQQMNQTYENLENYYGELSSSAANLFNILPDSEARRGVEAYMTTMDTLQNKLSSEGITRENKRAALGAKTLYNQYMAPTAQAAEKALKEQAKVNELRLTNPNILIQGKSGLGAIDTYLKDPQYSAFNVTANLDVGKKQIQEIANNMMKDVSVGKLQKTGISYNYLLPIFSGQRKDVIDKYQMYNALKGRGSQEDLRNFLSNVSNEEAAVFNLFDKHLNTTMNSIGMTKENGWNDNQIQQASEYISQAWYNAIAPTQYKPVQDTYGMNAGLENYKRRNSLQRLTSPYAVLTPNEIDPTTKDISNKYRGSIKKIENGKIIYSQNALQNPGYKKYKEYTKRINALRKSPSAAPNSYNNSHIIDLIKERDALLNDPTTRQGALLGELDDNPRLRDNVAKHFIANFDENNYDAYGYAGIQLNITDGDILKNLQGTLGDKVPIFKKAQQSNSGNIIFEDTGKTINPSELDWKQATLISINGSTVFRTKNGDGKDIYLDASKILNSQGENVLAEYNDAVKNRSALAKAKASGVTEVKGENIDVLIERQQQIIDALTAKHFSIKKIDDVKYKL